MIDYTLILAEFYADAGWSVIGDDYDSLVWEGPGEKPSRDTLDAAWPDAERAQNVRRIQAARQARYRAEADPLFFEAQRGEDGTTLDDWKAKVAEIKADLPYPV